THTVEHRSGEQRQSHTKRYLDSSTSAFANSIWHSSTRRVNHRNQPNKAEFFYWKYGYLAVQLCHVHVGTTQISPKKEILSRSVLKCPITENYIARTEHSPTYLIHC
uniref:Uncharacterized protein n=1 Tax=Pelusios castaneus TaxID=367368 RepID=A0A8C8VL77_9SAUR